MDIEAIFKELGLKEEHLKVYLANLEWGETSISNLAYKSKVPRTTVYENIRELIEIGLIKHSVRGGQKFYAPSDPEMLLKLLENRSSKLKDLTFELQNNMTQLKAIQNVSGNKAKIHLLEGAEGIMQAYEMTLNTSECLIQCLTDDYGDVSEEFFDNYFKRFFFESKVKSKEILRENEDLEYIKKYGSGKNLQLRVPVTGEISTDFMVFDNTVIYVSFDKKNSYALVIEDPKIANCARTTFNLAWESAKKTDKRILANQPVLTDYVL